MRETWVTMGDVTWTYVIAKRRVNKTVMKEPTPYMRVPMKINDSDVYEISKQLEDGIGNPGTTFRVQKDKSEQFWQEVLMMALVKAIPPETSWLESL